MSTGLSTVLKLLTFRSALPQAGGDLVYWAAIPDRGMEMFLGLVATRSFTDVSAVSF